MRYWPFLASLVAVSWALPSFAQTPAWQGTLDRLASQVGHPAVAVKVRSVAIKDISDERTQARWPLSDQLEAALAEAIARQHPTFAVLNAGVPGVLGEGEDAILTGTYARDPAARRTRLTLWLRRTGNQETLLSLPPVQLDDADLPAGAFAIAGFGRIAVNCNVPSAAVFVDGQLAGKGALAQPLPVGSHVVTVAAEGYDVYEAPVDMKAGAPMLVSVNLHRSVQPLRIEGRPAGARLLVDGHERGTIPALVELTPGKHALKALAPGYVAMEKELDWDPSRPATVSLMLDPSPGSLLVSVDGPAATLTLDGQPGGRSPRIFSNLLPGTHRLRIEAPGYQPWEQPVAVESEKMASLRIALTKPDQGAEVSRAIALVPRTPQREDVDLTVRVAEDLKRHHPDLLFIDPVATTRVLERQFPDGFHEDGASIAALAAALKVRQIDVIGVESWMPFKRSFGVWPSRPELSVVLNRYHSKGSLDEVRRFEVTGGEPWGLGSEASTVGELSRRLSGDVSDTLAGEGAHRPGEVAPALDNETFLTLGGARLNPGVAYERRVMPFVGLGVEAQYYNALDLDRTGGTQLSGTTSGTDLIYGIGQALQTRLDATLRLDGSAPRGGPVFDGDRWVPYLGLGYRLDLNRYEVYGVGRKVSEGGYWLPMQRGVAFAGLKLNLGGALVRAEVETPVLRSVWDTQDMRFTVGAGTVW